LRTLALRRTTIPKAAPLFYILSRLLNRISGWWILRTNAALSG
jgi:hypothetical protein